MKKLKLIIAREFIAKVKNKTFLIMTFLSPLLMIGMGALVVFLMNKNTETIREIAYVDASGLFSKTDFVDSESVKYIDFTAEGMEATKEKVAAGTYYGVVYIPKKNNLEAVAASVEFYSKDAPGMTVIETVERSVNRRLRNLKMTALGIDLNKIKASKISSNIKMFNFSGEESSKLINGIKVGVGTLAGYLLMMFVIIYGTSVMRSVIEEKTSRIIEVIVSSVKPFQLMMGKIIGNAAAGLLQFFIWGVLLFVITSVASAAFGVQVFGSSTPEQAAAISEVTGGGKLEMLLQEVLRLPLLKMAVLFVFYFLGGFMLYSSLYAAIGAAVDNETDTQQFMFPIIAPLMLAVYVGAFTVIKDPHGPISVMFSHIPFTSSIVMLMRVPFGVSWGEIAISMTLLVVTFIAIVWLAAKIYRVGILMYGKKPTYKDLWKWLRYNG